MTIGFAQWMALALPLVLVMLIGTWIILIRLHPVEGYIGANAEQLVRTELKDMRALTSADRRVASIFVVTALAWVLRPVYSDFVPGLDDSQIAILSAVSLFCCALPQGALLLPNTFLRFLLSISALAADALASTNSRRFAAARVP